jgi:adiponectin receptor
MVDNEFITDGYRPNGHCEWAQCLRSVFQLHNETGNIWSHLGGLIAFSAMFVDAFTVALPAHPGTLPEDYWAWGCFALGVGAVLSASTLFHVMMAHSERAFRLFMLLDYCGIVLMIWGSLMALTHYLVLCDRVLSRRLMAFESFFAAAALLTMAVPRFMGPGYRLFRTLLFGGLAASGLVPFLFYVLTTASAPCGECRAIRRTVFGLGLCYLSGAAAYALRFPEKTFPGARGRFNFFLHSHQLMHLSHLPAVALTRVALLALHRHMREPGFTCELFGY